MKVLFVITTLKAGGAEKQLSLMANYWANKNWEVTIATLAGTEVPPFYRLDPRIRLVPLGVSSVSKNRLQTITGTLKRIRAVRRHLRKNTPDVVISFLNKTNVLSIAAGVGLKIPVIVSERIDPAYVRKTPSIRAWVILRNIAYCFADTVTVQTERARSYFTWLKNTRVIPNMAVEIIQQNSWSERDLNQKNKMVISAGRLREHKRFDLLMEAFSRIADRHPHWQLTIWGEGPQRSKLEKKISSLNMADRITMPGFTTQLESKMMDSHLFVLSSRWEGFPNVLSEAMACGLPVISTDCRSGPAELITPGHNGLLVKVDDIESLASAMDHLMTDPDERQRLGINAREVVKRYSPACVMGMWENLIRESITKKKG